MLRNVLMVFLSLTYISSTAQILVRDDKSPVRALKATTTVFIIPNADKPNIEAFRKVIGDVWTVTPFIVATSDSVGFINSTAYSVFSFSTVVKSGSSTNTHVFYALSLLKEKKSRNDPGLEPGATQIASIMLYPDESFMRQSEGLTMYANDRSRAAREAKDVLGEEMINGTVYNNWGAGYLKSYLKFINTTLLAGKNQWNYGSIHADGMQAIPKDTLYIPEYLNATFNPMNGVEGERDAESLDKAYPYPHRLISNKELNEKILTATKPIYYMLYVKSSTDKFVTVFDGYHGKVLYSIYKAISYNFKSKDLRKVAEAME